MNKKESIILGVILIIAFFLRIQDVGAPLADYHSSHQASTVAVARNYVQSGIDLLYPRHDDSYNYQYNQHNPERYSFMEFPLYSAVVAFIGQFFPWVSLHVIARIVTIVASLGIIGMLYYLTTREYGLLAGASASLLYSVFPFFVFFSRIALSDTFAVFLFFLSIIVLYVQIKHTISASWSLAFFILSLVFYSLALLVRPAFMLFFFVPLYLFYRIFKLEALRSIRTYLFFGLSMIPILLWQVHVSQYQEGVTFSYFLVTVPAEFAMNDYLVPIEGFLSSLLFERITTSIFGGYMVVFFILGLFRKTKRTFFHWFLPGCAAYLLLFQGKHLGYEYYQTLLLAPLALATGIGISFTLTSKKTWQSFIVLPVIMLLAIVSYVLSNQHVRNYYQVSDETLQYARVIRTITQSDDRIVTDTDGNTTLLFLSKRSGSSTAYTSLEELKKQDFAYLATSKQDVINRLKEDVPDQIVFTNNRFALIQL